MNTSQSNSIKLLMAGTGVLVGVAALALRRPAYDVRNKTALITGGSRGLGLILARELAERGASVAICARSQDELETARQELASTGARVIAVPCDITHREEVNLMVERVLMEFGRIDILINNAGVIQVGPMEVMTLGDYEEAMQAHFWGPLYTTLAVLPDMRRRHEGRIVNISSIGGKISVPHLLPYCASKFALTGLSEGLHAELAGEGITVTTVCPGLMRTGSPRNATFKGKHRDEYAWFSISDSLPVTSINARRAARQIISAMRRGDAEVVLTVQAKIAAAFHGLFPGFTAELMGIASRLLPSPGGIGEDRAAGKDSQSAISPSPLTALSERAAAANNEM